MSMRVTGGILRGRNIRTPGSTVRPTQDRIREALFSILGERVKGARFLDLFAGSGAVGLEAWSRGAEFVCWVESDRRVLCVLKANVNRLCPKDPTDKGSNTRVIGADAIGFLMTGKRFDIIFADPPYLSRRRPAKRDYGEPRRSACHAEASTLRSKATAEDGSAKAEGQKMKRAVQKWLPRLLEALGTGRVLAPGGLFVMEQAADEDLAAHDGWSLVDDRVYGDTRLRMFQKK